MKTTITLENLEEFSIPLNKHLLRWKFEEEEGKPVSAEYEDQIIPLNPDASQFLWKFRSSQPILGSLFLEEQYFKVREEYTIHHQTPQQIKKWLYNRGIPFDQKVFWTDSPTQAFILTWKMVIKFSENLFFASDELIWDASLNWVLTFDHNDVFYWGKNRIYNSDTQNEEKLERERAVDKAIAEGKSKAKPTEYAKSPYKK